MVKKTEIDGESWVAVEKFKIIIATILLLGSLAVGIGSYFVNSYRLDQVENAVAYIGEDYVSREVLELRMDKIETKIDGIVDLLTLYVREQRERGAID